MSNTTNNNEKFTIVKLMKNNTVEYPVTRPECVIYKDGTTVASRLSELENGVDVTYNTYRTGCDKYLTTNATGVQNVSMFNDKDSFHAYQTICLDSIKKSYYALTCNNVNDVWYTFKITDSVNDYVNGNNVLGVIENSGDNSVCFSIKHFASLMYGYAPQQIRIITGSGTSDIVYDKLISMDVEICQSNTIGGDAYDSQPIKVIKLVMGKTSTGTNSNDVCEFYFTPSMKKDMVSNVNGESVVYDDGYFAGCYIKNAYIKSLNTL